MRDDAVRVMYGYAGALRYALALKRAGLLSPAAETELGRMLQNIGRFAIASMTSRGQLTSRTGHDPDFIADVYLYACIVCERADLTMSGKAIFSYIVKGVKNRIKNRLRNASTMSRTAVLVDVENVSALCDFDGTLRKIEQITRRTP